MPGPCCVGCAGTFTIVNRLIAFQKVPRVTDFLGCAVCIARDYTFLLFPSGADGYELSRSQENYSSTARGGRRSLRIWPTWPGQGFVQNGCPPLPTCCGPTLPSILNVPNWVSIELRWQLRSRFCGLHANTLFSAHCIPPSMPATVLARALQRPARSPVC